MPHMACKEINDWIRQEGLVNVALRVSEYWESRGKPKLGVTYQSVQGWIQNDIPLRQILAVEHLSGIDRQTINPEQYPPEEAVA
jgi:hypothetical protein